MNDWQTETDPLVLLNELFPLRTLDSAPHQTRKCRLYLAACARRQWDRLPGVCRALVALAEVCAESPRKAEPIRKVAATVAEGLMHSDGEPDDLRTAALELAKANRASVNLALALRAAPDPLDAVPERSLDADEWRGLAALVYLPFVPKTPPFVWAQAYLSPDLIREIYYNPKTFPLFNSEWRTTDVLAIARGMYDARAFDAMPILADALQDAGCNNADILDHCRARTQLHVRGCWVLDMVLDPR